MMTVMPMVVLLKMVMMAMKMTGKPLESTVLLLMTVMITMMMWLVRMRWVSPKKRCILHRLDEPEAEGDDAHDGMRASNNGHEESDVDTRDVGDIWR